MDWLRWILLAVGAVLIGAIYLAGRRSDRAMQPPAEPGTGAPAPASEPEPYADWLPTDLDGPAQPTPAGAISADPGPRAEAPKETLAAADPGPQADPSPPSTGAAPEAAPESERVILLYLLAPEGERLVGARLADAFARHGLEHGELGAFHARSREADGGTDFSIVNVVEPGGFDPATMGTLSTPGLVLALRLPGPPAPGPAFERMLAIAHALAEELDAHLLDERRAPLTCQTEQHLRDGVRAVRAQRTPAERSPR